MNAYAKIRELAASSGDTVTLDVPLLIRVLEWAREEAHADVPLHFVAERLTSCGSNGRVATMADYAQIVPSDPEQAAYSDWWSKLSKKKQQAYLKDHPHSEFMHEADALVHDSNVGGSERRGFQRKDDYGASWGTKEAKKHTHASMATVRNFRGIDHDAHVKIRDGLHEIAKKHGFGPGRFEHHLIHPKTGAELYIHEPDPKMYTDTHTGYELRTPREALDGKEHASVAQLLATAAGWDAEHEISVLVKGDGDYAGLLACIGDSCAGGSSTDVVVSNGGGECGKFSFDGDGADRVVRVTVDGAQSYPEPENPR